MKNIGRYPFDTNNVSITHLSSSPDGFELVSDGSLGKTEDIDNLSLSPEEKDSIKNSIQDEMQFQGADDLREARTNWRRNIANDDISEGETEAAKNAYLAARKAYQASGKKVGIRALRLVGDDTLAAQSKVVHFPLFNQLSNPQARPEIDALANVGTALTTIVTADNRLILQHRALAKPDIAKGNMVQGNASYGDVPGVSAAGFLDASFTAPDREPGTPDVVDREFVENAIKKEINEELGISDEHITNLRIVGVAYDKIKPHDEFLLIGETDLSASDLRTASHESHLNKNLGDADFDEKFIDIPATPEAIQTLLSQVRCPIPPTHVAGFVATGYSLVLKQQGREAADSWKTNIEHSITKNNQIINSQVANFYKEHPEAMDQVPERFWGKNYIPPRNPDGYSPAYGPEEQGLPSFTDEMVRTGLMPEARRFADSAWLLDVDGVVTDPIEKRVTNESIIEQIAEKLDSGDPVGLNSGRPTAWMETNVLPQLIAKISNPDALQNLIIIGEKGGTWTTFNEKNEPVHNVSPKLKLPDGLEEDVANLIQDKYADSMFGDMKETMVSAEMHNGHDLNDFHRAQEAFANDAQTLIDGHEGWRIDKTTIATDFENVHTGKALGTDRFLDFLKSRDITVGEIVAFGDSPSDLTMSDELSRRGINTQFIYVGSTPVTTSKDYNIHTYGGYTSGTTQALRDL